jgi:hypothetical protein
MKKILITSVLLFFGLHLVAQEKAQTYTSELGKFSMTSYGEVTEDVRNEKTSTIYRAAYRNNEMLFSASGTLYTNKIKRVSNLLKASLLNFTTAVGGTIVERSNIKENKVKGIYALLNLEKNDVQAEYKVFSKGLYLYQVMVFAKKGKYKKEVAASFFKSFAISK